MLQVKYRNSSVKLAKSRRAHNYRKVKVGRHFKERNWRVQLAAIFLFFPLLCGFFYCIGLNDQVQAEVNRPLPRVLDVKPTSSNSATTPESEYQWSDFVAAAEKVSEIYNFPSQVVLAQGALESSRGTSTFAKERNNFLGIGAYDSDPNQAFHFENPEQCVVEYMRLIRKNFPEAWANRENPEELLKKLKVNSKGNMYATDPNYVEKVMSMNEWK